MNFFTRYFQVWYGTWDGVQAQWMVIADDKEEINRNLLNRKPSYEPIWKYVDDFLEGNLLKLDINEVSFTDNVMELET